MNIGRLVVRSLLATALGGCGGVAERDDDGSFLRALGGPADDGISGAAAGPDELALLVSIGSGSPPVDLGGPEPVGYGRWLVRTSGPELSFVAAMDPKQTPRCVAAAADTTLLVVQAGDHHLVKVVSTDAAPPWSKRLDGSGIDVHACEADADGYFLAGTLGEALQYDGEQLAGPAGAGRQGFLMTLDHQGGLTAFYAFSSFEICGARRLGMGRVAIAGRTDKELRVLVGRPEQPDWTWSAPLLADSTQRCPLDFSSRGELAVLAGYVDELEIGPWQGGYAGATDVALIVLSEEGTPRFTRSFGSASYDVPRAVSITDSGIVAASLSLAGPDLLSGLPLGSETSTGSSSAVITLFSVDDGRVLHASTPGNHGGLIRVLRVTDDHLQIAGNFDVELDLLGHRVVARGGSDGFFGKLRF